MYPCMWTLDSLVVCPTGISVGQDGTYGTPGEHRINMVGHQLGNAPLSLVRLPTVVSIFYHTVSVSKKWVFDSWLHDHFIAEYISSI